jgi:hypothetical protein
VDGSGEALVYWREGTRQLAMESSHWALAFLVPHPEVTKGEQ